MGIPNSSQVSRLEKAAIVGSSGDFWRNEERYVTVDAKSPRLCLDHAGITDSDAVGLLSASSWEMARKVRWESVVAYGLAVLALYDSFYDIRFFIFLRKQEHAISGTGDHAEAQWGYGQILAVFVWVPVILEYTYALGWKTGFYKAIGRYLFDLGCRMGLYKSPKELEPLVSHEYQMVEHVEREEAPAYTVHEEANSKGHDINM